MYERVKVRVSIDIEVPRGATHFKGRLDSVPIYYKVTQVGGFDHWWVFYFDREGWYLSGHREPRGIKSIPIVSEGNQVIETLKVRNVEGTFDE